MSLLSLNELTNLDAKVVKYKRSWCYLRKISRPKVEITRALLLEVKKIKDLQHDHITRFIGICLDPGRHFIFVEFCQKGSLQDLLENKAIELETSFKHHLIHDIIKGMLFIHGSEIKCHGRLTSANCVVDSRFTLKLTDFGVPSLHHAHALFHSEEAYYKKQMWRAPELQVSYQSHLGGNLEPEGTQKGDVYSFAVIVQEILYRQGVFYLTSEDREIGFRQSRQLAGAGEGLVEADMTYRQIFDKIKFGLRPSLESFVCSREIIELLKRCWCVTIVDRPDFNVINVIMRKTTK